MRRHSCSKAQQPGAERVEDSAGEGQHAALGQGWGWRARGGQTRRPPSAAAGRQRAAPARIDRFNPPPTISVHPSEAARRRKPDGGLKETRDTAHATLALHAHCVEAPLTVRCAPRLPLPLVWPAWLFGRPARVPGPSSTPCCPFAAAGASPPRALHSRTHGAERRQQRPPRPPRPLLPLPPPSLHRPADMPPSRDPCTPSMQHAHLHARRQQ